MRHTHAIERLMHIFLSIARTHASVSKRQFNVLIDIQIPDKIKGLKDKPNFPVSYTSTLGKLQTLNRLAIENVSSRGRGVEQAKYCQESALSATGRPRDRDILS